MTKTRLATCALLVSATAHAQQPPAPAQAPAPTGAPAPALEPLETTAVSEPAPTTTGILLGARLGGIIPFDGLSPFVTFGIEVGYALPALDHRLAIVLAVDYTQPTATGSESDPRVTGGMYTWKLTEQELGIMPVIEYRFLGMKPIVPYVGIGPRMLLARSTVRDNGAPAIMETQEQSTRIGVGVPVGAELPLGPGAATGELLLQYGTLNHLATGDANTGAASVAVGYRFAF